MRRMLKADFGGDVRRLHVDITVTPKAPCGSSCQARLEAFRGTFEEILSVVRVGYSFSESEELLLKYSDEELDLCTLTEATVEDFLFGNARSGSCADELTPLKLVVLRPGTTDGSRMGAAVQRASEQQRDEVMPAPGLERKAKAPRIEAKPVPGASQASGLPSGNSLRSMCPLGLLACLKALHSCGRLSPAVVASLALQFLPILAQRVQRKQEKINRKGANMRKEKPLVNLLQAVCEQIRRIPEAEPVRPALKAYIAGSDTAHLGDTLADLLRRLAACKSRAPLATALLAVGAEMLAVLPCLCPETFGARPGAAPSPTNFPGPLGAQAAAIAGAAVHEGFACARCGTKPIVGPRFELVDHEYDASCAPRKWAGDNHSLCGECFARDSTNCGPGDERCFVCRLAPEGYNAEAMLQDKGAAETWARCQLPPLWGLPGGWLAPDLVLPAPAPQHPWHQAALQMVSALQVPLPFPLSSAAAQELQLAMDLPP
eukprot:TRINITY_DN3429_c0_g1_i1.p1 TRINITY_DN3429_c0_g1~~TRINITY_DN3429_c0_g1_i1.p1  ORF type:complete len:509 (-),score=103.45 TRINITY_DN3429_c0_g1_i1:25-1488(-)